MQQKIYYIIFTIVFGLMLIASALFSVDQRQSAVVFQFGEAIRTIENPGLNIKIPFIQNVEFFDKRLLDVEVEAKELTAADGKRVIVDAYAKFQINNPVMFYKTVHDYQGVKIRLTRNLESSMRKVIGKISLSSLLSQERSNVMLNILNQVNGEAKSFGIDVVDVRILRADLPKENSAAIYRRMQTAREKEATQIRAEGQEESVRIRSKADKESKIILAKAYRDAQIIKGDGDEKAAKIYNAAYSVDPEFYKFYRSLLVYKNALKKEDTNFVISPEAEVFKYLNLAK
ncbi:HFLC protein (hflC) [Rickettsia prowazekii str. GvV257]|uniref:Protein HflC n=2 Tax=Rickettsia prowazekii TaxID=782 RepID=Q9ZE25_RICPR|nr:protease modulator HflC [Rickettsia prowazekii]EOB10013.1 HflC protein [Rickettsia prowazekii str. GvF12]ADE29631.1 Membrane proteasesubunit,stomatin/prohibitin-like protein [Rickettsia prowazekii str. Rp22]AFE49792.1 HFLC protein (hflC) [Rickettsia prowazekii str. Katsinyian]AFE50636.1 HFLC protein (hflC) [Rickettsia prowazekii str. BuV67-CWPP]AFE52572.1 HFLC protein (hflC) [Rickettsia prowazekii str. GvV257]